jgi:hypothetical protein
MFSSISFLSFDVFKMRIDYDTILKRKCSFSLWMKRGEAMLFGVKKGKAETSRKKQDKGTAEQIPKKPKPRVTNGVRMIEDVSSTSGERPLPFSLSGKVSKDIKSEDKVETKKKWNAEPSEEKEEAESGPTRQVAVTTANVVPSSAALQATLSPAAHSETTASAMTFGASPPTDPGFYPMPAASAFPGKALSHPPAPPAPASKPSHIELNKASSKSPNALSRLSALSKNLFGKGKSVASAESAPPPRRGLPNSDDEDEAANDSDMEEEEKKDKDDYCYTEPVEKVKNQPPTKDSSSLPASDEDYFSHEETPADTYLATEEYAFLESDLPEPDSDVLFEAFSPKRILLESSFEVTFSAYNVTDKKEIHDQMNKEGNKTVGVVNQPMKLALRTPVQVILKNPHKDLESLKQREEFVWDGNNVILKFAFKHLKSRGKSISEKKTFERLLFLIYVRDVEVARIKFSLTLVPESEPVTAHLDNHFTPEYTHSIQALYCAADQNKYLRWRLALKCANPNIQFSGGPPSDQVDIFTVFWSRSASIDLTFKKKLDLFLRKAKKLKSEYRLTVFVLDFADGLAKDLKPFAIEKSQYFKKFSIMQGNSDFFHLVDMNLKSIGVSHKDRTANSNEIRLGKEIGRGFFGAAYLATYGGKPVVVKKISLENLTVEDSVAILSEVAIMERCSGNPHTGNHFNRLGKNHLRLLSS